MINKIRLIIFVLILNISNNALASEIELNIANVSPKVSENYCQLVSMISSTIMTSYQYSYDMNETKNKLKEIINNQKINNYSKKINLNLVDLTFEEVKEYKIEEKEEEKNKLIENFRLEIYNLCIK